MGGLALLAGTGCSSPDSKYPYNALQLSEVRQSDTGQLALIYNTAPERTPGQRVFLVDDTVINHCVSTALQDIKASPGYGEAFSGALVLHRRVSQTVIGAEDYWLELDPFAIAGAWLPPLDQSPLPAGAALSALPPSYRTANSLALPNEHFVWRTEAGPLETTVSNIPLFQPNRRDTLMGKTEAVLGGTVEVVGGVALVGAVLAVECLSHGQFDLNYPLHPVHHPFPSYSNF